jgi:hypothetical protein
VIQVHADTSAGWIRRGAGRRAKPVDTAFAAALAAGVTPVADATDRSWGKRTLAADWPRCI